MTTWVDVSYNVYPDMKSHTGECINLGHSTIHYRSSKQKFNTNNTTKSELVAASDYLPFPIWTQ